MQKAMAMGPRVLDPKHVARKIQGVVPGGLVMIATEEVFWQADNDELGAFAGFLMANSDHAAVLRRVFSGF